MTELSRNSIKRLLETDNRAVERAMIVLYDRQTADEKQTSDTRHTNRRGFSSAHASKGSYYARWVLGGRHLTGRHLDNARKIACHYTAQLLSASQEKLERLERNQAMLNTLLPRKPIFDADAYKISLAEMTERQMQEIESRGDREQTIREEEAKERYKAALEDH